MNDIEAALSEIGRIRDQLAESTRFQGFTPVVIAGTGLLAIALAASQSARPDLAASGVVILAQWIVLAVICGGLVAGDAVLRARKVHRAMAPALVSATFRQFMPSAAVGAACAIVLLLRAPGQAWMLPGLWQMLVAAGICAALGNLPKAMIYAAGWYFLCGATGLALATSKIGVNPSVNPWAMGVPFGVGQILCAAVLHLSSRSPEHD